MDCWYMISDFFSIAVHSGPISIYGEFNNNATCFLRTFVSAYHMWHGDVLHWNQIADDIKYMYKVVSVFVFSSGMPVLLRQFLLKYCSISSIIEWGSPSYLRRDVFLKTKTPAKAFLKFTVIRIRIIACLNSFSTENIESNWSLSLLRSEDKLKLLLCQCLLNGFTSAAWPETIAKYIRYIIQWAQ